MYKPHQGKRTGGWKGGNAFGQKKPWERGFGDRDGARPTLYEATCSECGNACQVPFRPIPGRDVFCSNCFKKDGDMPPRKLGGMDSRRFTPDEKRMFKAVCDKCKNECEVPFRPTGAKPIYCRPCLTGADAPEKRNADQFADQFKMLNAKLDAILKALTPAIPTSAPTEKIEMKALKTSKKATKTQTTVKTSKKKKA